jgi:hypothetical protein
VTSAPTERERLEAAALALAAHFSDPLLSYPEFCPSEALRAVVAFHAEQYAAEVAAGADFLN